MGQRGQQHGPDGSAETRKYQRCGGGHSPQSGGQGPRERVWLSEGSGMRHRDDTGGGTGEGSR